MNPVKVASMPNVVANVAISMSVVAHGSMLSLTKFVTWKAGIQINAKPEAKPSAMPMAAWLANATSIDLGMSAECLLVCTAITRIS
jgi:hypothetical protein